MRYLSKMDKVLLVRTVIVLLTFTFASRAAAQTCVLPPSGLVSWWDADDVTGTTAGDIQDGNDGTINGATIVPGMVGNAFSFDGDDVIDIPDAPNLDMTTEMTISMWVKDAATNQQVLISKWDHQTRTSWALQTAFGGNLIFFVAASLTDPGNKAGFTSGLNLQNGISYYLAIVYNGNGATDADRLRIYVDGSQQALLFDGTIPTSLQNSAASIKLGRFGGSLTRFYSGDLDEVQIFNRALSQAEIQAEFDAGSAGKCKDVPFADFTPATVEVEFQTGGSSDDRFAVTGAFTLDATSNGIDPVNEEVVLNVGTATLTIPTGFTEIVSGVFQFTGLVNGATVTMEIAEISADTFQWSGDAEGVDLTDTANPVGIELHIGDDFGATTIPLQGTLQLGGDAECSSSVTTIEGLRAEADALTTSPSTINVLNANLDNVQTALDNGNNKTARSRMRNFISRVVNRSNFKETNADRILLDEASDLICSASNVLIGIPLP